MELNFDCTSHMFTVMVNSDIFNADIFKGKQSGNDRDGTWLIWNIAEDGIFWIHCSTAALIADGASVSTGAVQKYHRYLYDYLFLDR